MSYLEKQNLGDRSDRLFKLMLIEPDPIYRAGLRVVLAKFADLQVVAEAETNTAALQILSEFASNATSLSELGVDLVLLELRLDSSESSQLLGLKVSQQLKTQYPNLPVLLFTSLSEPSQLATAKQTGVDGYCPKGIPATELAAAIRQVATGHPYWAKEIEESRGAEEQRSRGKFHPLTLSPSHPLTSSP
jgi:DNA-binding NarL/FixJ family response regulator